VKNYFINRLRERSTWSGLIWCAVAFGVYQFTPEQEAAVTALGMSLAGAFSVVAPDKIKE